MIQLFNDDCLEAMKSIPSGSVDMILQDPPYNTTACKWEWDIMTKIDEFWAEWKRIIKPNGAIVMFGSEPFSSSLRISGLNLFKYDWIWDKKKGGNPLLSKIQPIKTFEIISVFGLRRINYYPQMIERKKPKSRGKNKGLKSDITGNSFNEDKTYTHYYPKSLIEFSNANQRYRLHPTQKPVALMEYLIKTYTNEGDTVFDGFAGSGTTAIACLNTGRKFIGCELDETYFNVAKARIEKHQLDIQSNSA